MAENKGTIQPEAYYLSQATLQFFADRFNQLPDYPYIKWCYVREESFDNDGYFFNTKTRQTIGFDWEYRQKYFENGVFYPKTIMQFERKIQKDSIQLALHADKQCTAILAAWHSDFKQVPPKWHNSRTQLDPNRNELVREIDKWTIYPLSEIREFKKMIADAFAQSKVS